MPRKTSRRFTSYSKQNDQQEDNEQQQQYQQQYQQQDQQQDQQRDRQQSNEWQQSQPRMQSQRLDGYENKANDKDSLIADMAQEFIQAQAVMADKAMSVNNLEIALLLQKVNDQLEEIKRSAPNSSQTGEQSSKSSMRQDSRQQNVAGGASQDNSKQQVDGGASKKLQELLTSVLQGKNNNENSANKSANIQSNDVDKSNGSKSPQNMMAVQTVSQVLAQAQYELANELETSLKKLKQVISESEKLANDISNLLGEETMKKS